MVSFRYKVTDKSGRRLNGLMQSEDRRCVVTRLQEMGYFVLEVQEVRERSGAGWNPFRLIIRWLIAPVFGGVSVWHLAVFYRQFATMVKSGMTLGQAMNSLISQGGSKRLRKIAAETVPFLQAGGRLSDAFGRYPWVFPELHLGLIRAGEEGGSLDEMLSRIADYLENEHRIRQRLRLATLYPKILVLAVIFIPPFPALLLSGVRAYLHATLGVLVRILIILLILWTALRVLNQIPAFRYGLDMVKLAVPKLGKTVKMLALAKFYRVLAAMFAAGAPLSRGLTHAANATGNWFLATRLKTAIPWVEQGSSLPDSLERARVLPPMALDMIRTGEQTGNVDSMLSKAAEYTENEAEVAVMQSTVVLGVVLLLAIAAYIGCFVVKFWVGQYGGILGGQ